MSNERLWPLPDFNKSHRLWKMGSAFVIPMVGILSKIMANWLNTMTVHNRETLLEAIKNRKEGQPLITVSNHHSCLDDPVLWGMLDWSCLLNSQIMRWSAAAQDICFTNSLHSYFFALGKTFPVVRGDGVYQAGMDFCLERLNSGAWIHFFPEGRVNAETSETLRLKWGIGRLIAECKESPIVIAFYHVGMDSVLPNRSPYVPRFGNAITVLIGQPMNFDLLRRKLREEMRSARQKRKKITDLIQEEFVRLKVKAEELHNS